MHGEGKVIVTWEPVVECGHDSLVLHVHIDLTIDSLTSEVAGYLMVANLDVEPWIAVVDWDRLAADPEWFTVTCGRCLYADVC